MFELPVGEQTFVAKIKFKIPNNRGTHNEYQFKAKFLRLSVSEWKKELEAIVSGDQQEVSVMQRVFISFEEIVDAKKEPVAFSEEARDALLEDTIILQALAETYRREMGGGARRGN